MKLKKNNLKVINQINTDIKLLLNSYNRVFPIIKDTIHYNGGV